MGMNEIHGKVLIKETGSGVPDLLIVVYDLDPRIETEKVLRGITDNKSLDIWKKIKGDRLASVLTDENGKFELQYEDSQFQVRDRERRPDIALFVVAPEDPSTGPCPRILHVSYGTRRNAGRIEHYVIKLPREVLRKAGISIPGVLPFAPELPGVDDLLVKMKELAEERHKKQRGDKPFSEWYNRSLSKFRQKIHANRHRARHSPTKIN